MDINAWWETLEMLEKVFWIIAIPFSTFFIIQLILTFIGGDIPDDGGADFDVETDSGIPFQFLTLKNLVAFFTIFSWTGIACLDAGLGNTATIFIGFGAGLVMMLIMSSIMYLLYKTTHSGTMNIQTAKGATGEVYMQVKANRGNIGKIQVQIQGTVRTMDALTDDAEDLNMGAVVNVNDVANNNILIITKSKL